jgi:cytosine/adenosine deaminase-related metal-dependent hydrolase
MRAIFVALSVPAVLASVSCGSDGSAPGGNGGSSASGGFGNYGAVGGSIGSTGGVAGVAGGGGMGGVAGSGGTGGSGGIAGGGGVAGGGGTAGTGGTGGGATITPGAPDKFLLQGAVVAPSGPMDGEVLVEGTTITCVAASCSAQPGAAGATVITTHGVILPGLIDPHNHGLFNLFDEADWTPTKLYGNHNQWTAEKRYGELVDAKQSLESASGQNVACEMDKFAETKALMAGTTSFVVAATARKCYGSLVRTIDTPYNDLGVDTVRTSIAVPTGATATSVCSSIQNGSTKAYVVHVGEGVDATAKNEFTSLQNAAAGCLMDSHVTVVHGTAFTAAEYQAMAAKDMGLVWSPKSNVFLYNATADIPAAIQAGIKKIALGPDWALGGSINMLDELRFADQWDNDHWNDTLTKKRLFEMASIDAARALGYDSLIGSLEVGKRADLFVIGGSSASAYDDLLAATPSTVRLVMVDGRALYGDQALQAAGPANPGCEAFPVCGVQKFLCAAEAATTDKLDQTFAQYQGALVSALAAYDTSVSAQGIAPFSPIAQLTKCP